MLNQPYSFIAFLRQDLRIEGKIKTKDFLDQKRKNKRKGKKRGRRRKR